MRAHASYGAFGARTRPAHTTAAAAAPRRAPASSSRSTLIGAANAQETAVVRVVDADGQPIAGAAVYLPRRTRPRLPQARRPRVMDQVGYQFVPTRARRAHRY
jgi:hypothetical protein